MSQKLISSIGTRVAAPGGNILSFKPMVPRDVSENMVPYCLQAGCFPVDGLKDVAPSKTTAAESAEIIVDPMLKVALIEILETGDNTLLTADGFPRATAVRERFAGEVNAKIIKAGMKEISENDAS